MFKLLRKYGLFNSRIYANDCEIEAKQREREDLEVKLLRMFGCNKTADKFEELNKASRQKREKLFEDYYGEKYKGKYIGE